MRRAKTRTKTTLRETGEFGLIHEIQRLFPAVDPSVLVGIGDDTAVLRPARGKLLLMTTDTLREGVHFLSEGSDLFSVGWKSLAVSLSDIAAMGGVPRFLLLSLALPVHLTEKGVRDLLRGILRISRIHRVSLIGGNISRSIHGISVDTTVIGETEPSALLRRSGAGVGDQIYVTGTLGDAAAGLSLLRSSGETPDGPLSRRLVLRHRRPEPRLAVGRLLATRGLATSAIDISDGLLQDMGRICEQSGVGARIDARRIPLSGALKREAPRLVREPLDLALSGGEDYELLFTVKPRNSARLESIAAAERFKVTRIGEIVRASEEVSVLHAGGEGRRAGAAGYDHFRA
jgi:thiamine-monophosphate kinase